MSEVEVELYSGRVNPRFVLSAADAAELQRRLDALPSVRDAPEPLDILGYRGLRITDPDAPNMEVVVSAGTVEIRGSRHGTRRLADPGRQLERWLVKAGAGKLQQGELNAVLQELQH